MKPLIETFSGKCFNLLEPTEDMIDIEDIAHHLSKLCRFNGACKHFYSVAQHSILVSHIVPRELALFGLLHDAAEAYVGDMSSPLKSLLPEFKEIEDKIQAVILRSFGLYNQFFKDPLIENEIKKADIAALLAEKERLMLGNFEVWERFQKHSHLKPPIYIAYASQPEDAKFQFMERFYEIKRDLYQ